MGRALLVLDSPADRQKAVTWVGKAPVGTRVEFKASKRSLPQNDLMWALLTEFAQQFEHAGKKYDPTQWKAIFLHAFGREVSFLPSLDGKTFLPIEMSSSDLSKQEMTDFIEFIIKEAAERGVILSNPNDSQSGSSVPLEPVAEDVATSVSAASDDVPSPSSDATSSAMEAKLREHIMDFARKALKTENEYMLDKMISNYRTVIGASDWSKLSTIKMAAMAVIDKKRTVDQARDFIARDILDCSPEQIGGAP